MMKQSIALQAFVHSHVHAQRGDVVEGLSENTLKELEKNGLVRMVSDMDNKMAAALSVKQQLPKTQSASKKTQTKPASQQTAEDESANLPGGETQKEQSGNTEQASESGSGTQNDQSSSTGQES